MHISARKIATVTVLALIVLISWQVVAPFVKDITRKSLQKQINIELASDTPQLIPVTLATTTLSIELAVSSSERELGLGGRQYLEDDAGLLFIFDESNYHSIWMKGMLFSIDIAWLDQNFRILDIEEKVSPSTYPETLVPDLPARYVLEVNAGFFKEHGITVGTELRLSTPDSL